MSELIDLLVITISYIYWYSYW